MSKLITSEGDSAYRNFILYVTDGDAPSAQALELLSRNPLLKQQTFIQEVAVLASRPPWLTGTPIIVDKKEGLAHRGTIAFEFIRAFQHREAMGQMGRRMGRARRNGFSTGMADTSNVLTSTASWDVTGTPAAAATGRVPVYSARAADGKVKGDGDREVTAWMAEYKMGTDSAARTQKK